MGFPPGATKYKDTEDNVLYIGDWTDRLTGGTTITASEWTVIEPGGDVMLTAGSDTILPGAVTTQVLLSGGTPGKVYRVENKVTLSGTPTQILERSFYMRI
jgi:hypothetical protein